MRIPMVVVSVLMATLVSAGVTPVAADGDESFDPARNVALPCESTPIPIEVDRSRYGITHVANVCGFVGTDDVPALKRALGLPDEFEPIGVMPVGIAVPDKRSPSLKRGWVPFEEFARWERWD